MASTAQKRAAIPFNKEVFKWARLRTQRSYEEAAKRVGVPPEKVAAWEAPGKAVPTVRQARLLAAVYRRPFLEFFARTVPEIPEPELVPDFRMRRGVQPLKDNADLVEIQEWAESQRLNALDLYEMLGEEPTPFPDRLFATTTDQPKNIAATAREVMQFPIGDQTGLRSRRDKLPQIVRGIFERNGILVLRDSALADHDSRGMCVFAQPLPTIVIGNEAPGALAFTLGHELGHVVLRQSGISGPMSSRSASATSRDIEKWCDAFAGAFLIPEMSLRQVFPKPLRPAQSIGNETLSNIAAIFGVSRHAMMVRLVSLSYITPDYYWSVMKAKFDDEEARFKAGGRPKYYGQRYRSNVGDLYTGLVLEAWGSGQITNHNAAEFMGIKNLTHLEAIRDHFAS